MAAQTIDVFFSEFKIKSSTIKSKRIKKILHNYLPRKYSCSILVNCAIKFYTYKLNQNNGLEMVPFSNDLRFLDD